MPVAVAGPSLGERVRQGDPEAFEAVYREYGPPIYDFLVRTVRDGAAAEDLVQATFVKAFEHRATRRDPAKLGSWLWATAHNQAMNHLTRQRRNDPLDEQFDLATLARGPEESAEAKDAAELVWLAAASLEPRQYTVLDLTLRRDLSTQEVAEALGVPVSHASVLVNRAREALGHAVRYLLVARRRDQCHQLAGLVPVGVRALTPEQRSAVDHHMRRCERCRELGDRLTAPAELLGTFILLPLPAHLAKLDSSQLLSATGPAAAGQGARHANGSRAVQHTARSAGHHALTSSLQLVITIAVAVAVTVPQAGSASAPPVTVALAAGQNQPGVGTVANAGPAASRSIQPAGTAAPVVSFSERIIAIADPPLPLGTGFTRQPTTVRLFHPDGTEANPVILRAGIRILAAAGPRIFLLEPGGVLKAVKTDGTVEDLGRLGTDLTDIGKPRTFAANPDGTQWVWGTLDSGAPDFREPPVSTMHSSIHLAGIGLAARAIDQADEVNFVIEPWGWSAAGPVIADHIVCCGLGGGPGSPFHDHYAIPVHILDLDHATRTAVTTDSGCPPPSPPGRGSWAFEADGTHFCPGGSANLATLILAGGQQLTVKLPEWTYSAGDAYLSPTAQVVAVGLVGDIAGAFPGLIYSRYETYLIDASDGSTKPLALSGVLPAMYQQWAVSSWLPDGSLMVFREAGAPGGDPGTYVVSPSGKVVRVSSLGPPIGVLQIGS
jgi:RNA polymerase sigma factor (sigma-70 family)